MSAKANDVTILSTFANAKPVADYFPNWVIALFRVLLFLALLIILFGSLSSGSSMPSINNVDKILHLLAYGGLSWLAIPSFHNSAVWKVFCVLVSFGVGIEIAQSLMDFGRQGSLLDIYANVAGVILGVLFWVTFKVLKSKKHRF